VSPKLIRLMFVATVVAGVSAPVLGASAAGQSRTVDAWNPPRNFEVPGPTVTNRIEIAKDDTVSWIIWEGEHTVTPKDQKQWGGDGSDPNAPLTSDSPRYSKTFAKLGDYVYYCSIHGGINDDGPFGMWGRISVIDTTPNTQPPPTTASAPPPTQPPATTTTTTRPAAIPPAATPPATTATAPTTRPGPTAPAPTTTNTAKPDKKKAPKDDETTTTSTLPPPIDLPNEAIVPSLPGAAVAPGSDPELPTDTPEGEALALLKGKKGGGGDALKLLIVSGLGLGALGAGTAGYKYANRSSKYFPA
jgi:plastocyanin